MTERVRRAGGQSGVRAVGKGRLGARRPDVGLGCAYRITFQNPTVDTGRKMGRKQESGCR